MHVQIGVVLHDMTDDFFISENSGFEDKFIDFVHLCAERLSFLKGLELTRHSVENFTKLDILDSLGVMDGDISESILLEDGALLDKELADFNVSCRGGKMERRSKILVVRVDIEALTLEEKWKFTWLRMQSLTPAKSFWKTSLQSVVPWSMMLKLLEVKKRLDFESALSIFIRLWF